MNYWLSIGLLLSCFHPLMGEVLSLSRLKEAKAIGRSLRWVDLAPSDPHYQEDRPGPWLDQKPLVQSSGDVLNFAFSDHHYWFTFTLHNSDPEAQTYALEVTTAWLDQVLFFEGDQLQIAGDTILHREWTQALRFPVFLWTLGSGESKTFWIRIVSKDNLVIPMMLWNAKDYKIWDQERNLSSGLFYGLLLTVAVINAAMFMFSRRRSFLIYTLYIISYSFLQFTLDGFLYAYIPWITPALVNQLYPALNLSTLGLAGIFVTDFLNTKRTAPRIAWAVTSGAWICLGASLLCLTVIDYQYGMRAALLATLLYSPWALICAALALKQKTRSAWFFTAAWTPLILAILILGLTAFGLFPSNIYSRSLLYFGIAFEFIILSIGLGDKLQLSIKEHETVKRNLESAEAVQKALIPAMPEVPGWSFHSWYQSADSTGGDWYEVIPDLANQRLYCFIGDVTGHGISSTLVTSAVAGAVHGVLHEKFQQTSSLEQTLDDLLVCVNRTVHRTGISTGRLLTMNLIGIDLKTHQGLLLNAGHCHPLIFRQGKAVPIMSVGSMLGLSDDIRVMKKNFHLEPKDILFLYTDGLVHKHSHQNVELKLHRAIRFAAEARSAKGMIEIMREKYQEVYGSQTREDDCSLLAIEVTGDSPTEAQDAFHSAVPSPLHG